jgi:fructose-1-phosphate kinase PfkB-like protein
MQQYNKIMDLSKYTPTELLKIKNDLIKNHDEIKEIILNKVDKIDDIKNEINENILEMNYIEGLYNKITEELEMKK